METVVDITKQDIEKLLKCNDVNKFEKVEAVRTKSQHWQYLRDAKVDGEKNLGCFFFLNIS